VQQNRNVKGLGVAAVWADNHIIDRIMGDDKWHRDDKN